MNKLLIYSHDTFGIGNIRRMLAIAESLLESISELSILVITGSPIIRDLRLPPRLDYIKLPCLTRTEFDVYSPKTLGTSIEETIQLRSDLIFAAAMHFEPDVVLIDKKPCGIKGELTKTLRYLKGRKNVHIALVLRDILDEPAKTISAWQGQKHSESIAAFYDKVLVLGAPEVFDPRHEYRWPQKVRSKAQFCGYLGKRKANGSREQVRTQLGMRSGERLVLVTAGGGEDGRSLLQAYCAALGRIRETGTIHSLVITGPEMSAEGTEAISEAIACDRMVTCRAFVDNMMACMEAADLVVSMGGYNTVCEILSADRPAVVVPRAEPVKEQWIRADRMSQLGLFSAIHPSDLTPNVLADAVTASLARQHRRRKPSEILNLNALANVNEWVAGALHQKQADIRAHFIPRLQAIPATA